MKVYHIVSGHSAAWSLRYYLNENHLEDKILNFVDDLSTGPLCLEYTDENIRNRVSWIKKHLFPYDCDGNTNEIVPSYTQQMYKLFATLREVQEQDKIYIWVGEWIIEQLMLRRILCSTNHKNIFIININNEVNEFWTFSQAMWECSPEQIWNLSTKGQLISSKDRQKLIDDFHKIVKTDYILHIYENGEIIGVNEDYYDNLIMSFVTNKFMPAAKVVGDTLGYSEQKLLDNYIQHRLSLLIQKWVLLAEWDMKALYDFKIKKA